MTALVHLLGGPLDGKTFQVSGAAFRIMARKPLLFRGAIGYVGAKYDFEERMIGDVRREGLYKLAGADSRFGNYVGPTGPDSTEEDPVVI